MKKQLKLIYVAIPIVLLFQSYVTNAQNNYNTHINTALRAYISKQYLQAAQLYSEAFSANHNLVPVNHRIDAARVYALAGLSDSAFYQLSRITNAGYYQQLKDIFADDSFDNLKNDRRWVNLTELLKLNGIRPEAAVKKNYRLIAELAIIEYDDQHYRLQSISAEQQYGIASPQVAGVSRIELEHDSINQLKVKAILDKYGWPEINQIGSDGSYTIFEVIQHAPLAMQLKYLPMVKDVVKRKLLDARDVAILEDRIDVHQHKKQRYGSQLIQDATGKYYVQPLKDPYNIDKIRARVGLQPLKEYLSQWKLNWDIKQYKKDLPKIEKLTGCY